MSRVSVKFFYGPLYLTPYICCGREPGMWGYPGCVWISIGWLTWSVQFSLSPPRLKTLPRPCTPDVTPTGGAAPFTIPPESRTEDDTVLSANTGAETGELFNVDDNGRW